MKRAILTMLVAGLLTACAGDFSPTINDSGEATAGTTVTMTGDDAGSSGATGDDAGSSGASGEDTDGASSTGPGTDAGSGTGEPPEMPGPDEPCDPMLAADGIAPCHDPEMPTRVYSCAPTYLMPDPNLMVIEFRCLPTADDNTNGIDIGDPCDNGGLLNGGTWSGCLNAYCLNNGLETSVQFDEYRNHPPGACPFEPDGTLVRGCCSPYCDDTHPCDQGWQCSPLSSHDIQEPVDYPDVGTCVWVAG